MSDRGVRNKFGSRQPDPAAVGVAGGESSLAWGVVLVLGWNAPPSHLVLVPAAVLLLLLLLAAGEAFVTVCAIIAPAVDAEKNEVKRLVGRERVAGRERPA